MALIKRFTQIDLDRSWFEKEVRTQPLSAVYLFQRRVTKGKHGGRKCGRGDGGMGQHNTLPRIGVEGHKTPFVKLIPKEPYYYGEQ